MRAVLVLAALLGVAVATKKGKNDKAGTCPKIETLHRSLRDSYCDQPIFLNFITKSEQVELFDNVCITLFPLPDDPNTFQVYASIVYCDGSYEVFSVIATDILDGVVRGANPFFTTTVATFGYVGCDTYLLHICNNFPGGEPHILAGGSSNCLPIGFSCLRKVQEVIKDKDLDHDCQEFYVLPMKLPNRCVSQQKCLNTVTKDFYRTLGLAGPVGFRL